MAHDHSRGGNNDSLRSVSRWVFFGFVGVAAYFLITEHRAHLFGWLPFLLLAACPLMHFFHHRGHGEHGPDAPTDSTSPRDKDNAPDRGAHRH